MYYYCCSPSVIMIKLACKWFSAVVIPIIPFSNLRIQCYRWCGYKIVSRMVRAMLASKDTIR